VATESRRLDGRPARVPQLLNRPFHEPEASVRKLNLPPALSVLAQPPNGVDPP
jgi:hypothetical protein